MGFIIIMAIIAIFGYYVSLKIHPLTKCRMCDGRARHYGTVYTYAFRRCRKCGGTGRKDRFGVRFVNRSGS